MGHRKTALTELASAVCQTICRISRLELRVQGATAPIRVGVETQMSPRSRTDPRLPRGPQGPPCGAVPSWGGMGRLAT